MASAVALLGAGLLPVAWLVQTYRTYEAGNLEAIDPKFVALYVVGSALLTYHAVSIGDLPFTLLNLTMTLFTATELGLLLVVKRDTDGT